MESLYQNNNLIIESHNFYSDFGFTIYIATGVFFIVVHILKSKFTWFWNFQTPLIKFLPLVIGILLIFLGIGHFLFSTNSKTIFDTSQNKLYFITQNRIQEVDRREYSMKAIKNLSITQGYKTGNDYEYLFNANFKDGYVLTLAKSSTATPYNKLTKDATKMALFLNIPFINTQ